MTFLGLTLTSKLGGQHWSTLRRISVSAGIGFAIVVGGVLGALARFGPVALATCIEGFGAITLAYLVTEELLREAHREEEQPLMAAMFFVGFICASSLRGALGELDVLLLGSSHWTALVGTLRTFTSWKAAQA